MSKTPLLISIISITALLVSVVTLINLGTTRNSTPTAHESMQNGNLVHDTMDESIVSPTMPGQEAFGTIQEIMDIIEADTQTDWSSVDLEALRQHLIDMNELTMNTQLTTQEIPGGIHLVATAETPRTITAIQRMVSTHDQMTLQSIKEWDTTVTKIKNGVDMKITSQDLQETEKLRGLGFIGVMATGADHPTHHLMMARGDMHSMVE